MTLQFCSFEKERSLTATVTVGGINGVGEPIIWCVGVVANQGITKLASAYAATLTIAIACSTEF